MYYVTAIHPKASAHESIQSVRWLNSDSGKSGQNTITQMVSWFEDENGSAKVAGPSGPSIVAVVKGSSGRKWLRTHANGEWNDNLLALASPDRS